jgi:hypothetical protein
MIAHQMYLSFDLLTSCQYEIQVTPIIHNFIIHVFYIVNILV